MITVLLHCYLLIILPPLLHSHPLVYPQIQAIFQLILHSALTFPSRLCFVLEYFTFLSSYFKVDSSLCQSTRAFYQVLHLTLHFFLQPL